jgi:hypothetical protein
MAEDVKAEPGEVVDLTEGSDLGATTQAQPEPVAASTSTGRRDLGVVLAILAMIVIVLSVEAIWMKTTLEDEERFVETLAPLAKDPAVATAVSARVADAVVESEEFQSFVTDRLPPELDALAVPISAAVRDVISTGGPEIIQSDAFADAWAGALRATYPAAKAVLTGNDAALVSEGGVVSIDLNELASTVTARIEAERGIDLPEIQSDLGSIVLLRSDRLATAQNVLGAISTAAWVLPLVALLLVIGAVWAHPDNRWMVAFLGFGTALVALLSLVIMRVVENTLLGIIDSRLSLDAFSASFDTVTEGLRTATWALIVLTLIVGFLAWINGPSSRAQRLRTSITGTIDGRRRAPEEEPSGISSFLAVWKRTIQGIVVLLALAFLIFGPSPSGISVLFTAVVTLGVVILVEVLAGAGEAQTASSEEKMYV